MKRLSFLSIVGAAGAVAGAGVAPRIVFARERIAGLEVRARADRQWMHGRLGACAFGSGHKLKLSGYTLQELLS